MQDYQYVIADEVFQKFPGYVRGVVLAYDLHNGPAPAGLLALLRQAEEAARAQVDAATIAEHPHIRAWREAFRAFGAKPSEYRSSIEAMARRVARGDPLPAINALVDIGNVISLRHLLPAGAHAIDALTADLWLRPARGDETFTALDGTEIEHPLPGEIVYTQGGEVLTRRWVWRQGLPTLVGPATTAAEFNVDGLPPATPAEVEAACRETAELVAQYCGGQARWEILSAARPRLTLRREP